MVLTGSLPAQYENFITTLDSTLPADFTLKYVIAHLLNEASHHEIVDPESNSTLMVTKKLKRLPLDQITCFKCGEKEHYQVNCPKNSSQSEQAGIAVMGSYAF